MQSPDPIRVYIPNYSILIRYGSILNLHNTIYGCYQKQIKCEPPIAFVVNQATVSLYKSALIFVEIELRPFFKMFHSNNT